MWADERGFRHHDSIGSNPIYSQLLSSHRHISWGFIFNTLVPSPDKVVLHQCRTANLSDSSHTGQLACLNFASAWPEMKDQKWATVWQNGINWDWVCNLFSVEKKKRKNFKKRVFTTANSEVWFVYITNGLTYGTPVKLLHYRKYFKYQKEVMHLSLALWQLRRYVPSDSTQFQK